MQRNKGGFVIHHKCDGQMTKYSVPGENNDDNARDKVEHNTLLLFDAVKFILHVYIIRKVNIFQNCEL